MNKRHTIAVVLAPLLLTTACNHTPPCEDIVEVNRQIKVCQQLAKTMNDNRSPQQAMAARQRYQAECEDFRFYRDDYDTICKGQQQALGAKDEKKTKPTSR